MTPPLFFSLLIVLLNLGASIANLFQGDYVRAVYWMAAAVLNVCIVVAR